MARGDYVYINKKSNGNSSCYGGIRYRITNSLEDAIATNKDVIEMIMYVYRTSTGVTAHTGNYTSYYKHTIAGTTTTNNVTTTIDMSKATNTNTKYYLSSSLPLKRVSGAGPTITFEVPHNTDGSAPTVSIQAYIEFGTSSADYVNVTQTLSLDSIPRNSVLNPIDDFGLDDSFNISIDKSVDSYTDNLVIKAGTTTIKTYNNISNGTSISFTSAEQNTIKGLMTSPQIELTFELSTYSGGTQIGTTSTQTANVTTLDQPVIDSWYKSSTGYKYCVNGVVDSTLDDGLQVVGNIYLNGLPMGGKNILKCSLASDYTISATGEKKLTLATIDYQDGTALSKSDGGIKIGSGITSVKVWGSVYYGSGTSAGDSLRLTIKKNTDTVAQNNARAGTTGTYETRNCPPVPISVQENDIIYLYENNATGARGKVTSGSAYTYLVVEEI